MLAAKPVHKCGISFACVVIMLPTLWKITASSIHYNNLLILLESTVGFTLKMFYMAETPYLQFAKIGKK